MADILFKADDYIFDVRTVGVIEMETNMPCPVGISNLEKLPLTDLFVSIKKRRVQTFVPYAFCGRKNVFGDGMAERRTISLTTISLNCARVRTFPTLANLYLTRITVTS